MSEEHKHTNYMKIFYILLAMTVAELGLAMTLQSQKGLLIVTLVTLALIKAGLVAAFFMHLKLEKKTFVVIVCVPLILAVVLVAGLFPDVGFKLGGMHHHAPAPTDASDHPTDHAPEHAPEHK